jgi:multiple sugar transport system permease protein
MTTQALADVSLSGGNPGGAKNKFLKVVVVLVVLLFLFPLAWMVISSFEGTLRAVSWLPFPVPTFENYARVLGESEFGLWTFNTVYIAAISTGLAIILGLPAAYGIAQFKQGAIGFGILLARIAPGISYIVPWYIVLAQVGMVGSYTAVILGHLTVVLPLAVWLMIGFFEDVPHELREAAFIDGCSEYGSFWRVALPIVRPGTVATAIICFTFSWNHTFVYSLILSSAETQPLPVAILSYIAYGSADWPGLMAAATMITLPVLILAWLVRKQLARGFAGGAVKG